MADDGYAQLEAFRRRIARVKDLPKRAAPVVAAELERITREHIAKGVDPDGRPWPLRQDGKRALQTAGNGLSSRAVGTVALVRLDGKSVLHHLGAVRGGIKRQILPGRRLPPEYVKAVRAAVVREFRELQGGT